jgi:hypothetical protein
VNVFNKRWVRVGLVAVAIFLINAVSRLISRLADRGEDATGIDPMALIGAGSVVLLMIAAAVYWSVRYPFSRMFFDLGGAAVVGALLSLLIGPFVGGNVPFEEGLGFFVGQFLQFLGLAALGVLLGFAGTIVLGKDWKSRGLKRYEERYQKRPHRTVR